MGAVVVIWIVSVLVGAWIGSEKNRTGEGVVLALLLGLIGVIIIAVLPTKPDTAVLPASPRQMSDPGPWPAPSKWGKQPPPRS